MPMHWHFSAFQTQEFCCQVLRNKVPSGYYQERMIILSWYCTSIILAHTLRWMDSGQNPSKANSTIERQLPTLINALFTYGS